VTVRLASSLFLPTNTMVLSYFATSPSLTAIASSNPRLIWRTIPSDAHQGELQAVLSKTVVEPKIKSRSGWSGDMKVALVHKGDAYGQGIADVVISMIIFNGKTVAANGANFLEVNYGDGTDKAMNLSAAQRVIDFGPDMVIGELVEQGISDTLATIESSWTATWSNTKPKPLYILSEGSRVPTLQMLLDGLSTTDRNSLRGRIYGTSPGPRSVDPTYNSFLQHYNSVVNDGTQPNAYDASLYDAIYIAVYAIVAVGAGKKTLTGPNIANSMSFVNPGSGRLQIQPGPNSLSTAFNILEQGNGFDYVGYYGPQDFDLSNGETLAQEQVWCAVPNVSDSTKTDLVDSGMYQDPNTNSVVGTISAPGCPM
jgi:ABC-type branched-subunit amino acid transport system substrate-binding protein